MTKDEAKRLTIGSLVEIAWFAIYIDPENKAVTFTDRSSALSKNLATCLVTFMILILTPRIDTEPRQRER
jgi:hypothetical protein